MSSQLIDSKSESRHEESPYVGGYRSKIKIGSIVKKYIYGLAAITLVHNRGAQKYECYSWLNDPNAYNSSVEDNIDAMYRHFLAHSMGKCIDAEGLPHIWHMCCRAGMMVTTLFRKSQESPILYGDIRDYIPADIAIGHQITPEEIVALSKEEMFDIQPVSHATLQPYLHFKLLEMITRPIDRLSLKDPFFSITSAECLFIAVLRYAEQAATSKDLLSLMDPTLFTEAEKQYIDNYLTIKKQ